MLNGLANSCGLVVLLDSSLQGFALLGLVGVVLVGFADEVAGKEEADGQQHGGKNAVGIGDHLRTSK